MTNTYDFIAVGGGSGGLASAQRAAEYGAKALVIERGRLGGTCVNVGCVPKKVMWHAADLASAFRLAPDYGFEAVKPAFDWAKLVERRENYIRRLNGIYERNLNNRSVDWVSGVARFVDAHTVEVDGERYTAPHIVIATGGEPEVPPVPGAGHGITSDGFFELTEQPRKAAVIGSGYIAVELAGVLRELGSEVELFARYGSILRSMDEMIQASVIAALGEHGVSVRLNSPVKAVDRDSAGIVITLKDDTQCSHYDTLIWAVGRRPLTAELGLEDAGIATDEHGYIPVDKFQRTNVAGVYAIGDVTGQAELTPVAIAAGRRLSDREFGGMEGRYLDYANIPTVVFSHPPVGTVGMTEEQAHECYGDDVTVFTTSFVSLMYGVAEHKGRSHMKLVTVGNQHRVVGAHIVGEGADEMLQGFAVAIRMGATKKDFDDTVAIHPTSAEEMVTMR